MKSVNIAMKIPTNHTLTPGNNDNLQRLWNCLWISNLQNNQGKFIDLELSYCTHNEKSHFGSLKRPKGKYSRTSLMWTPEGRPKSVHNSEVSTVLRLMKYIGKTERAGGKVSTVVGCPQLWGVHNCGVSTGRGSTVYKNTLQRVIFWPCQETQ